MYRHTLVSGSCYHGALGSIWIYAIPTRMVQLSRTPQARMMLVLAQCTSLLDSIYSDSTHVPAFRKRRRTEEKDTAQLSHLSLQRAVLADMAVCGLHHGGLWGLGSSLSKHCPPAEALQARSQDATCMHVAMMAWHEAVAPRRQVCIVRFAGGQPSHERERSAQPLSLIHI